jgi:hypothetical protein
MTEQRSSSAVRNLRSLFENKANADNDDNDPRGRSPSSRLSVSDPNGRPLSKIRSSFINVQHPIMDSPTPIPNHVVASTKRASAFENRTESFSTNNLDKDAVSALKKEVADEQIRRQSNPDIFAAELADEGAMESTTNTPAVEPREEQAMGVIDHAAARLTAMELPTPDEEPEEEERQTEAATPASEKNGIDENEPPANPDKPTTGAEEEKGALKPAMAVNEDAVSGGQALPPVAEDLRPKNKKADTTPPKRQAAQPTATPKAVADIKSTPSKRPGMSPRNSHRPDPVATGSPVKAAESNLKSPISERKSSTSSKSPLSPTNASKPKMDRKTSRSSLTAPTAASSGRERRASSTVKSTAPAAKRETTKPANLPSHLTAPTAASRARQEAESNKVPAARPVAVTRTVPKQQISSSRPAARASTTARPESRSAQPAAPRKSNTTAAPSESFLERMMRPTAASASKTHDKPNEAKPIPQRTKSSAKPASAPKTNGTMKPAAKSGSMSKPLHPTKSTEEKPVEQATQSAADNEKAEEQAPEVAPKAEETIPTNGKVEETEMPDIPIPATENGSATPQHGNGTSEPASAALESTPAFGQDEIR